MEKEYIKINRDAYNKFAIQHNRRTTKPSKYELSDKDWENIIENSLINKNKKNNILEIGPGTGRLLKIIEDNFNVNTTAVELSKEMIKYAKEKSPNTSFIEGNILEVNFKSNEFDAIIMGALIHNFPKEDAIVLLQKCHKWLKITGKIMLYTTLHEKSDEGYCEKEDYEGKIIRYRKKYTEQELIELLEDNNYKIINKMVNIEKDRNKKWITLIVEIIR